VNDPVSGEIGRDLTGKRRGKGLGTAPRGKDRLTVHLRVSHDHQDKLTTEATSIFDTLLDTIGKPVTHEIEVGPTPVGIETYWLGTDVGYLLIKNPKPTYTVNPTHEERTAHEGQTLRVIIDGGECALKVSRGRCFLAEPERISSIQLQCLNGPLTVEIHAFPA
jgi:hypothetical protein